MKTMKNMKEQQERTKPQLQLVPRAFVEQVAERLALGARQRGEFNWRRGVMLSASVYVGKALRHLHAYADGELDDAEGGSHLAAAAADIAIMLDAAAYARLQIDLPGHGVREPAGEQAFVGEYYVWYNDDTKEWAAMESPMHGPVQPLWSSYSWMFVGAVKAMSNDEAIAIAKRLHPGLQPGLMRSSHA